MKLYNTLTRKIEEFKPIKDRRVLFYHCGPTVYWIQHIGNLRAMVWADLIRRTLIYLNYQVKFVRNYTDVGHLVSDEDAGVDKMEKGVKREGLSPDEIADKYIKIFESDTKSLNIIESDFKPRATQYISQIINMIKILLDKGFAYITNQAVVYDTSKFSKYNELNKQNIEELKKGKGKGTIDDPEKKHFSDFNLWVFKKGTHIDALQTWSSPWGEGFPGWHIECSAMSKALLGDTIDIHMGGIEHIPVHHTNEIAQSEATNKVKFVNYWIHNEHLDIDGKKMAKSENTGYTLKQLIDKGFSPMDLRYFFLNAHYRSKQNFTFEALKGAQIAFNKLKEIIRSLQIENNDSSLLEANKYQKQFNEYISNDFQISQALALTWDMLKSTIPSKEKLQLLFKFDQIFGLKLNDVEEIIIPKEILNLAEQRNKFRSENNWSKSDELRKQIEEKEYIIEDQGKTYKIRSK